MKTLTINKYNDPGHGWFALPVKKNESLQLDMRKYEKLTTNPKGTIVFFEEDCEFNDIIDQLEKRNITLKVKSFHGNKQSKIRNYPFVRTEHILHMRDCFKALNIFKGENNG